MYPQLIRVRVIGDRRRIVLCEHAHLCAFTRATVQCEGTVDSDE